MAQETVDYDGTVIGSRLGALSAFDVATGAIVRGPSTDPLRIHEVREQDGQLQAKQ